MSLKEAITFANLRKNRLLTEVNILNEKIFGLEDKLKKYNGYKETINNVKDQADFVKIGTKIGLNLNPSPIYFNLSKEILKSRLNKTIYQFTEEIKLIKEDIEKINDEILNIYICPTCGGSGKIVEVKHHREDNRVVSVQHPRECTFCKGRGKIHQVEKDHE